MKSVISAVIAFDNSTDEAREYNISLHATINGTAINGIDNGQVQKVGEENVSTTFNGWGNNQNFQYNGLATADKNAVNIAVDEFLTELTAYVAEGVFTSTATV